MRISKKSLLAAVVAGLVVSAAPQAQSQTVGSILSDQVMLGINRSNGNLSHYSFATQTVTTVGAVKDSSNTVMTGIDAAAYFAGFDNIYAFWQNPGDGKNKLVYIEVRTAKAVVVNSDVEGGKFTGAVGVALPTEPYAVFAVQAEKVKPPATISGLLNINPSNSAQNEFTMTTAAGATITRDTLHNANNLPQSGTYYEGDATFVHVKPKGNGNQNGLIIDGVAFQLQNSNTYDFSGAMVVRLYTDKVKGNGTAMGHWWLQIVSGTVLINNDVQVLTPNRIARIDQKTGTVTEIMPLARSYSGLASTDGTLFYTTFGADLYKIDTINLTETKVHSMPFNQVVGMNFVNSKMMSYDWGVTQLAPLNASDGQTQATPVNLGLGALGSILFTPQSHDPTFRSTSFD